MKLKAISYNIHKGFDLVGSKFVLHEIKSSLLETGAELVLLQEVVGENSEHATEVEKWPTETQFEFLADTVWPHYSYGKNAVFSTSHHGNALLSKYPIVFSENIDISTNRFESRGLLHCIIEIPPLNNKRVHVFNTHLDLLQKGRKTQFNKILSRIQSSVNEGDSFIVGGDFNDWGNDLSPLFIEHLGVYESHVKLHGKHAKSFPSIYPFLTLDRLYYKHMTVSKCQVLAHEHWKTLSDPLPLLAEFEID